MKRKKYYAVTMKDLLDLVREGWEQMVREAINGERHDDRTSIDTGRRDLSRFRGDQNGR